ncbi:hypothetical protein RR46_05757 [Papilio xuthus]|uniref:Uncharacterized protein n=1 Tax=Papilio xuthus TaxID=66420 RepID=A0A194PTP1_PAPXU|nr:hypothetical protein RR46_05757 [Papilio xuthus]
MSTIRLLLRLTERYEKFHSTYKTTSIFEYMVHVKVSKTAGYEDVERRSAAGPPSSGGRPATSTLHILLPHIDVYIHFGHSVKLRSRSTQETRPRQTAVRNTRRATRGTQRATRAHSARNTRALSTREHQ